MMQEKRGMMKKWNVWLIFATFLLTLLGTDLTRSGLVSSVHAFAQSSIGSWFHAFMLLTLAICLFTFIRQSDHLQSEHQIEALVSRESSFLFNNLVLLTACFTVLWGTLFPLISEYVQGNKVTVGAPFYNRVAVPIGLFLMLLTGVGPLLAWRSASFRSIRRNLINPGIAAAVMMAALFALGLKPWTDTGTFYSFTVWVLAAFVVTAIASEFLRGAGVIARHTGQNLFASAVQLTRRNTRRYGGYIIHFGVAVIFIGFAGSAFNQSKEQELGFHDRMQVGPYTLVCQSYTQDSNLNYDSEYALLDVYRGGRKITQMAPEKRFYAASQQTATMVANHSTLAWDLYVVYAGKNPDSGQPIIKVFLNPLVAWIWIGVMIVVGGTAVALSPNLTAALAASRTRSVPVREALATGGGD
jgi:cytochrome c-type biogenesis protein CcmF